MLVRESCAMVLLERDALFITKWNRSADMSLSCFVSDVVKMKIVAFRY